MLSDMYLAQIFLGQDYEGLRDFFVASWTDEGDKGEDKYLYRIYLAQKCLNLNELFYNIEIQRRENSSKIDQWNLLRNRTFISQAALLYKADELAAKYSAGKFPRLLVVDELVRTGRDFGALMYCLIETIQKSLEKQYNRELTVQEYSAFRKDLLSAIDFRAYIGKKELLLLEPDLFQQVHICVEGDVNRQCTFAQQITRLINLSISVRNTSFTPTFYISEDEYKSARGRLTKRGWHDDEWLYRNSRATIWQKSVDESTNRAPIQFAVYCYMNSLTSKVCITPYVFWGNVSDFIIQQLLNVICKCLKSTENGNYKNLIDILSTNHTMNLQIQLLSSVLSLLLFFEFVGEVNYRTGNNDLVKVAQVFGKIEDILPAFLSLIKDSSEGVRRVIWHKIIYRLRDAAPLKGPSYTDSRGHDLYLLHAENYFQDMSLEVQTQEQKRKERKIKYVPWSNFSEEYSNLSNYLDSYTDGWSSFENKIGAFLMLLQYGIFGQKAFSRGTNSFDLKVGEFTSSIRFMHMYRFLPALIELERICLRNGLTTVNWAARFGEFLEEKEEGTEFQRLFQKFVTEVYRCGMRLKNWNSLCGIYYLDMPNFDHGVRTIQEWTGLPWPEKEKKEVRGLDQQGYLKWEIKNQTRYKDHLHAFFSEIK